MRWSIFSNSSKVTSFLRQVEGRKIFVKAVLYWTPVKCLFFLMYEAFYAKLQLRETFIIIPQKPDLHQKFWSDCHGTVIFAFTVSTEKAAPLPGARHHLCEIIQNISKVTKLKKASTIIFSH